MAKRDFDFKQFMLQKGDRVGMIAAGGLGVLLLLGGVLMLFGKDISLSPQRNADKLDATTKNKEQLIVSNTPSEAKRNELIIVPPEIRDVKNLNQPLPLDAYPLGFPPGSDIGAGDNTRHSPIVLPPTEFLAKVIHGQLLAHMISPERDKIGVLVDPPTSKTKKEGESKGGAAMGMGGAYGRMSGRGPGGGGMPPGMAGRGMMPGGIMGPGASPAKSDRSLSMKKFNELKQGDVLAENVVPLRAAEIAGSFPLKKQLEEFRKALRLKSVSELYDSATPQFEFRGVKAQRRTLTADGAPIKGEGWKDIDLAAIARGWALNNGRQTEPEDPALDPLIQWSTHLYMDRPIQIENAAEKYPTIETELPGIKKSVEELKNLGKKAAPPSNPYKEGGDIDPFGVPRDKPVEGAASSKMMPTSGEPLEKETGTAKVQEAPEFALLRLFDVDLEPGKTYEYQVKVLLKNPNYNRKDVRNDLAATEELESEWVPVGHKLFVPEEIQYYAVDMKKKEPRKFVNDLVVKDGQAALQIHRWVPSVTIKPDTPEYPAGEWSVAERVVIYRGENIGGKHKVKMPLWMYNQASFVLATNPTALPKEKHLVNIPFGGGVNDAVLLDITPDMAKYEKKPQTKDDGTEIPASVIKEPVTSEVLIVTAEGKLLLRDYDTDTDNNPERKKRVDDWKKRIKDIEEGDKGNKDFFNKGGGPSGGA